MTVPRVAERSWRFEVWDRAIGYTGVDLPGVVGGELRWQKNQAIKGQGHLEVRESLVPDLLNVFIRPVLQVAGWGEYPYGLWLPAFPTRDYDRVGWSGRIDLVTVEALLSYTSAASALGQTTNITVNIPAGANVTDWIRGAVEAAGFTDYSIVASSKVENAPQSYVNGETLLQVINTELQRIGYFSIYSTMQGTLRAKPYVLPADRPESFSDLRPFDVDGTPFFSSVFSVTDSSPSVPNMVRAVGQPVGWLPAQTAVAVNNDPASPYSIQNRGYIVEKVYPDVSALSQAELLSYAQQRLIDLSRDGRVVEVEFLHLPGLAIQDVVYFNAPRAGSPMYATVDALRVDVSPLGRSGATLRSVLAVEEGDEFA